ncbi:MAG TPA: membrane protein insertion efficiency factor YidD [Bacteroidetes bacterium]|nr:membrane protein insertion efficiency factor YidD [Bacteroidota bacterium]
MWKNLAKSSANWIQKADRLLGRGMGGAVRVYQMTVGAVLPPSCRFVPTCSEYTEEAFKRFGAIRGLLMGGWRVLRCNPWTRGGYDPVPMEFKLWSHRHARQDGVR